MIAFTGSQILFTMFGSSLDLNFDQRAKERDILAIQQGFTDKLLKFKILIL